MILQKKTNKKLLFENHCHYIFIRKIPNFSPCTFFLEMLKPFMCLHMRFFYIRQSRPLMRLFMS